MSKICLVLGNGFTIDLIQHIGLQSKIDVVQLFSKGAELAYPKGNFSGFLTNMNCPALLSLGLGPGANPADANDIFEKIITCANFSHFGTYIKQSEEKSIYVKAYFELIEYLKFLFVWYDEIFKGELLEDKIKTWPWYKFLQSSCDKYDKIHIYTLNYDIYLERILNVMGVKFRLVEIEKSGDHKVEIYKPHGSISFISTIRPQVEVPYSIPVEFREIPQSSELNVSYDKLSDEKIINTIIPPFGDPERASSSWSQQMTEIFKKEISDSDRIIMSGLSYWHVDRRELDKILLSANHDAEVININPTPKSTFNAILQSRFTKFQHYSSSKILEKLDA